MPAKPAKTAGRARPGTPKAQNVPNADIDRLISLGQGSYAYILMPGGRTHHESTTSAAFSALLDELVEKGYGPRLRIQLAQFAASYPNSPWPSHLARLTEPA